MSTSPRPLTPYTVKQILLAYRLLKETVAAIMMLYKNMKVKVCLPDGDTDYFDIVAGCATRRHISPISVYYLPRRRALNVYRFNERKRFQAGNGKKLKIPRINSYGRGLR